MPDITAAAPPPKRRTTLSAAVEPLNRSNTSPSAGPYVNFDQTNRFTFYQQLSTCNPHVSTGLNKLGLSLVKGMDFQGKKSAVKEFTEYSKKSNFTNQVQTIARILCRDGTYLSKPVYGAAGGNFRLVPFLMPYTTILPDGFEPGATSDKTLQPGKDPEKTRFCVYEKDKDQAIFDFDKVVYGNYNEYDSVQDDIRSRKTFGLYGASLLVPLIPSIQNLLDINQGFIQFVKKYGNGRYIFNFRYLEELAKQEIIEVEDIPGIIDEWCEKHKYLSENEDIVGAGIDVYSPDPKGSLDITKFKESLETEIQIGLFQSPLTMGKASGTTYASSYMVEEDRMLVLEGLQKIVESISNWAINARLGAIGKPIDSVTVEFEELSLEKLTMAEMQEMYNTDVISKGELRKRGGFPEEERQGYI
jgi:hypothetical protein